MSLTRSYLLVPALAFTVTAAQGATIQVDAANCPGPGDGSVGDPYCSIQTAIDNSVDTDEILVAPGTYFETINFLGKAIWLHSSDGAEVTIIDAQQTGSVATCDSDEGPDTVLEGFTITGGTGTDPGDGFPRGGGIMNFGTSPTVTNCMFLENSADFGSGMFNFESSSPAVTNCTFTANTADFFGGGMYNNLNSNPTVTNCTFRGNSANFGGGMFNFDGSSPTVTSCTFTGNTAAFDGGGIYTSDGDSLTVTNCTFSENTGSDGGGISNGFSTATVTNCTFVGNTACCSGGGMSNFISSTTVTNCTFSGNSANVGGGTRNQRGSTTVTNCTFSGNSANFFGGGMENFETIDVIVTNCILWDNAPDQIIDGLNSENTVWYSDVQGGWLGLGSNNIDADPMFVDPDNGDYRLLPGSPCIDAGDNTAVPVGVTTDLDGNPRFVDDPYIVDTGNGVPPVVDMGAYELCLWDCGGDHDGNVGIVDFLALLAQWNQVGTTCDFGLGAAGVGFNEFVDLLANWGACP